MSTKSILLLLLPLIYIMPHIVSNPTLGVYMAEPVADIIAVTFTAILFSVQLKRPLLKSGINWLIPLFSDTHL